MRVATTIDAGALIRDAREKLGWSQELLARRIGVTRQTVASLEHGAGSRLEVFIAALAGLGIALDATQDAVPYAVSGTETIDMSESPKVTTPSVSTPEVDEHSLVAAEPPVDLDEVLAEVAASWKR